MTVIIFVIYIIIHSMTIGKTGKHARLNISVSLVIPVFNEETTAVNQLKQCEEILNSFVKKYEIIVADDSSKDQTQGLLKKYFSNNEKFSLIFNKRNMGIASNIKQLYRAAKYEYICLYSVDGDWNPYDIKKLITHSYHTKSDIVIGKRNKSTYSYFRKIISYYYNFLPKLLFHIDTIDAGSIKVIKKSLFEKINLLSKSVFFEAELIIKAKNKEYVISYLPISFKKNKAEKETFSKIKLAIISLIDLIKLRLKI
jgi:glycosyltransferase involved in cell wall biosynthesis